MKTLPTNRADDVDSSSDLSLFNLPRAAGRTVMSMAAFHQLNFFVDYSRIHINSGE